MWERIRRLNGRQLLGAALLVVSTLLWLLILIVPFLHLETTSKIGAGVAIFIIAEGTGYAGLALLGKEAVQALRKGIHEMKAFFESGNGGSKNYPTRQAMRGVGSVASCRCSLLFLLGMV